MTKEQQLLLGILASEIHDYRLVLNHDVDWQQIYRLSMEQCVAGVVFSAIQQNYKQTHSTSDYVKPVPSQVLLHWFAIAQRIEKRNEKVNAVLKKLVDYFRKFDKQIVVLKGQALAKLYPHPLTRVSGDIDIYFGKNNYDFVKKLLLQGTLPANIHREDIKHLGCSVDGVEIELHRYVAILPGKKRNAYFQKLMDCKMVNLEIPGVGTIKVLPPMQNLIFTFIHMFYHFISEGVGLRQMMDVAFLLKRYQSDIDESEFERHLREVGFLKAWKVFGCILNLYFSFDKEEIPCYSDKYTAKASKMMELTLEDGARKASEKRCKNKVMYLLRLSSSYTRTFSMFPKECSAFYCRLMTNIAGKYYKLITQ